MFVIGKWWALDNIILDVPETARICRHYREGGSGGTAYPALFLFIKALGKTKPSWDLTAMLESIAGRLSKAVVFSHLHISIFKKMPGDIPVGILETFSIQE